MTSYDINEYYPKPWTLNPYITYNKMNSLVFLILAVLTVGAALMVIFSRSPVSSILYLVLAFFGIAAFYVTLGAQFIAAVQIIVYAGAIMVLFLFVVMLLNLKSIEEKGKAALRIIGVAAGGLIMLILASSFSGKAFKFSAEAAEMTTTQSLGELLFTEYLVPFEIASVLLLAALVGAIVIARPEDSQ